MILYLAPLSHYSRPLSPPPPSPSLISLSLPPPPLRSPQPSGPPDPNSHQSPRVLWDLTWNRVHAFLPGLHAELFPNTDAPTPVHTYAPRSLAAPVAPLPQPTAALRAAAEEGQGGRSSGGGDVDVASPLPAAGLRSPEPTQQGESPLELDASGQYVLVAHPSLRGEAGGSEPATPVACVSPSLAASVESAPADVGGDGTLHPHPIVL